MTTTTPPGEPPREPSPEEIARALAEIEHHVAENAQPAAPLPENTPPTEPPQPTHVEQAVTREDVKAQRAAIRDQAKYDRERRREEWADEREKRREERRATRRTRRSEAREAHAAAWQARLTRWWRAFVLVAAIVGVNAVAVIGQVTAFTTPTQDGGFGWSMLQALAAAAVIESIAIYVGWHAHVALVEGDSVVRLRLASYTIAAVVGSLNYHHYAPNWQLDDQAVMFGMASLLSPWLWAIHSRHQHRAVLRAGGLIDPHAPKFSALRWLLHRSETWTALKWAVRHGEQSPGAAILAVQREETAAEASVLLDRAREHLITAQAKLIKAQGDVFTVTELVTAEQVPVVDEVTARTPVECQQEIAVLPAAPVTESAVPPALESDQGGDRERPDDQDNREAEKWIRAAMRRGRTPKLSDIRKKFPYSQGWAQARVRTARDELTAKGFRFLPANVVQPPADTTTSDNAEVNVEESS